MPSMQFTLSLEETNLILEALGQLPYVRVYQLIGKIQQQAETQLQAEPHLTGQPQPPNSHQPERVGI